MLEVRDFVAKDFLGIMPRPEESFSEGEREFIAEKLEVLSAVGRTIHEDGHVIFVCGFAPLNRSTAEVWWFGGPEVVGRGREIYRITRELLEHHAVRLKFHRVQATVQESFLVAVKFIERLGFHLESPMPRFGPNQETFLRYARFFDD